jgi:REP element-mobilizing transposase RayT
MPRQPRTLLLEGPLHVTARGNRRQPIFLTDGDRRFFLTLLGHVAMKLGWRVYAYCLLTNHYHLLVETSPSALSKGMQHLNAVYAQCFNSVHQLDGHLFQGRFYAGCVEANGHLLELTRYMARNPVEAGLCRAPAEWAWSSYSALLGLRAAEVFLEVDKILSLFSPRRTDARLILRRFVDDVAMTRP